MDACTYAIWSIAEGYALLKYFSFIMLFLKGFSTCISTGSARLYFPALLVPTATSATPFAVVRRA